MKDTSGPIWDAWNLANGHFVNNFKSHGRVTVQPSWSLQTWTQPLAGLRNEYLPVRWFQDINHAPPSNLEVEVPNIKTIEIDRSIDTDAATCTIKIFNTQMTPVNVQGQQIGNAGYFGWSYGNSTDGQARWGHSANSWNNVLVVNAMLRTYEGYGGNSLSIGAAASAGNITLTGTWLVDEVQITTDGMIQLKCRDMAKLLVDQYIYPPLCPGPPVYPLRFSRYLHPIETSPAAAYGPAVGNARNVVGGVSDPNGDGYWLAGTDGGVFSYGFATYYGSLGGNATAANPVFGISRTSTGNGYTLVRADGSVYAYGDAQYAGGANTLGPLSAPVVSIANSPGGYWLMGSDGAIYAFGGSVYMGRGVHVGVNAVQVIARPQADGYWIIWSDGSVYTFGGATFHGAPASGPVDGFCVGGCVTPSGNGYYVVTNTGAVYAYGDAVYRGGTNGSGKNTTNIVGIIVDPHGHGYWLVGQDGGIFTFGDATLQFWGSLPAPSTIILTVDGNYCADEETEILTKGGWLKWDEVQEGDETLSIDPTTGLASWTVIESLFRKHTSCNMMSMSNDRLSSLTTPNHKWLTTNHYGQTKWRTTATMTKGYRIPLAVQRSDTPTVGTFSDEFVELVAWFWTEGCLRDRASLSQSERVNPAYAKRIETCLTALYGQPGLLKEGHSWNRTVRSNGVVIYRLNASVKTELLQVMDQDKVVSPAFLTTLTNEQLNLFIETSVDADGCRTMRASNVRETVNLTQAHEGRARAFGMACALAGRATSTKKTKQGWSVALLRASTTAAAPSEAETYTGVIWCPTLRNHNWLARRRGTVYYTGNTDFTDIVKYLLLWSGFWLNDGGVTAGVFGALETTGTYTQDDIPDTEFDKTQVISALNKLKQIVGYIQWVSEDGSFNFTSPNWWSAGNFLPSGVNVTFIPDIDEQRQMTQYAMTTTDKDLRSHIIISTDDPTFGSQGTITTTFVPPTASELRGMTKVAMWFNQFFTSTVEQQVLAELVSMHLDFQKRMSQTTCQANPMIQVNDQVRIWERQTDETYVHYVRGVRTNHDLETGEYTMQLTTHFLGTDTNWVISIPTS